MKITFANMLASLCEAIPGADVDVVTQALGSDRRIGSRYLTGGLGYGGPCFPRDNVALAFLARALGTPALGPEATDAANVRIPSRVVARIAPLVAARRHRRPARPRLQAGVARHRGGAGRARWRRPAWRAACASWRSIRW